MHFPLVIRSDSDDAGGGPWGPEGMFDVYCDTSHGNAPDGLSYGGFVLMNKGGGALAWKCRAQAFPTDSPGAQELLIATIAYRWTLSLRMLLVDLELSPERMLPTPLWTDSQIILDGTALEQLGKSSRWLATRYAMLRFGGECGAIDARKCASARNPANLMTKPVCGSAFAEQRAALLGWGPEQAHLLAAS